MKTPLAIRFWRHVDKKGPSTCKKLGACWLWTGGNNGHYGVAHREDRTSVGAHIAAWFLGSGAWPTKNVLHKCDTPTCVKFTHLFEGTTKENIADKMSKGRQMRGEMYGKNKLTTKMVKAIKRALLTGTKHKHLALRYGVSMTLISLIRNGKKWRHVK